MSNEDMDRNPAFDDGLFDIAVRTMILQGYSVEAILAFFLLEEYEILLDELAQYIEILSAGEEFHIADA